VAWASARFYRHFRTRADLIVAVYRAGAGSDPRYDPRHLVGLLIAGLRIQ
jgi:AcrR family transcriptional regulator